VKLRVGSDKPIENIIGYMQYAVERVYPFEDYICFQNSQTHMSCATLTTVCEHFPLEGDERVSTAMSPKETRSKLVLPERVMSALLRGEISIVNSIPLRTPIRYAGMVPDFPAQYIVRHHWRQWTREALPEGERLTPAAGLDVSSASRFLRNSRKRRGLPSTEMLKHPVKKQKFDPIKLIRAIYVQHFLRDEDKLVGCMDAVNRYKADVSDDEVPLEDPTAHPSRTTRCRARHRCDVVDMLLERREFDVWYTEDLVESINVLTDASPVVGMELQGQVIDIILRTGDIHTRTLPGSALAYGLCGATAKAVSLMWAFVLVMGPEQEKVLYACSKVKSFTTDNGTEVNIVRTPDLCKAFYLWMAGTPLMDLKDQVLQSSRMWSNAIRIIGFGHTFGGIMYAVCNQAVAWPDRLSKLRALVHFYRNESYRLHLIRVLASQCDVRPLKSFDASFVKWRYETLAAVVRTLLPLRTVSSHLRKELFGDVQEKGEFNDAITAAQDTKLWCWMACAGPRVLDRVDGLRHWSMVCGCEDHVLERRETPGVQQHCPRASMRMGEVEETVANELIDLTKQIKDIKPQHCEGDPAICTEVHNMLQKYRSQLKLRTKYFSVIPWLFVRADNPEAVVRILDQLEGTPDDRLDPFSLRWKRTMLPALRTVRDGGPPSPELALEIKMLKNARLDEGSGEGYHRRTNMVAQRGPNTCVQTMVQEVRHQEAHERINRTIEKFKREGRNIIRHEWRNWKRILQSDPRKAHRNVRLGAQATYDRVYRMDTRALDNWDLLLNPPKRDAPDDFDDGSADAVQQEYLRAVFQPNAYMHMEPRPAAPAAAPPAADPPAAAAPADDPLLHQELVEAEPKRVFQVVAVHAGRNRPKLMPTILSVSDPVLHAPIALQVQWLSVREPFDRTTGRVVVYPDMEPVWTTHSNLGSFEDIAYRMYQYDKAEGDQDRAGCIVLSQRRTARPMIPLRDETCPALMILWHLQNNGWVYRKEKREHNLDNLAVKVLDGRNILRRKLYIMVLIDVEKHLRHTSSIPSDQTQLFYRLLMNGRRVEPNLEIAEYIRLSGGKGKILPLPAPELGGDVPEPPPEPPELDPDLVISMEDPPKQVRKKRVKPSALPLPKAGPEPKAAAPVPLLEDDPVAGPGGEGGGGCPPAPPTPPREPRDPTPPRRAGSSGDPLPPVVGPDDAVVVAPWAEPERVERAAGKRDLDWVDAVGGGLIRHDSNFRNKAGKLYPNCKISCLTCPKIAGKTPCQKTIGITPETCARRGRIEPIAFLHAWRSVDITKKDKSHARHDPTHGEVDAFIASHRVELEELADRLHLPP